MARSIQDFVDRSESKLMQRTVQFDDPNAVSFKNPAAREPLFDLKQKQSEVVTPIEVYKSKPKSDLENEDNLNWNKWQPPGYDPPSQINDTNSEANQLASEPLISSPQQSELIEEIRARFEGPTMSQLQTDTDPVIDGTINERATMVRADSLFNKQVVEVDQEPSIAPRNDNIEDSPIE